MSLLSVLSSLPTRTELLVDSPRTTAVKSCVRDVTEAIAKDENSKILAHFSQELMSLLRSPLEMTQSATMAKRRERMWSKYVYLRANALPSIWKEFLITIKCSHVSNEPLFMEVVNEAIFEELTKEMYETEEKHTSPDLQLTKDEQNIIRYACGYVAMKLQKKYLKQPGSKAAVFVECLNNMEVDGPTSSLLAYTREWVDKSNRGGLFDISDGAYHLFVAIEVAMRQKLTDCLKTAATFSSPESSEGQSTIINFVSRDCDVLFHWAIVSVDIEDEQHSSELLEQLIKLWLRVRGFSISQAWMEDYKAIVCQSTKKKKSLRKHLKKHE